MTVKINADTTNGLKLESDTSGAIDLQSNGTTKMTVTSSDITAPSGVNVKLHGSGTAGTQAGLWLRDLPRVTNDTSTFEHTYINSDNSIIFTKGSSATTSSNTEHMRIDSSGNVYFGTTGSAPWTATSGTFTRIGDTFPITATAQNSICAIFNRNTGDGAAVEFKKSGTVVGSISVTASNTAYNTSSDYRLKENVNYTFDATTELKRLKPCKFNFIGESETVEGFLAHEVSNVVPLAVTGTKDATKVQDVYDDDNNVTGTETVPDYQGIDQSKLVPLLVKTCQEQQTIIEDLQTRITALENN